MIYMNVNEDIFAVLRKINHSWSRWQMSFYFQV